MIGNNEAFNEGFDCFKAGINRNPYKTGTVRADRWSAGWNEAKATEGLFKRKGKKRG